MDTCQIFNQLETGCWIFPHTTFRLRAKKRLEDEILNGYCMPVEGLYTKPSEQGRFNGKDVFDGKIATLLVGGQFINGTFYQMGDVKIYFYANTDHVPSMISLMQIAFHKDGDFSVLTPISGHPSPSETFTYYTFCVNTVFPNLDAMATKLVSE